MKYLRTNTDENVNWKQRNADIAIKLNKTNGILSKLRHFIERKTLKLIYPATLQPHLHYSSLFWALKNVLFCKRNPYGLYIF